jgi:hypothetical protein
VFELVAKTRLPFKVATKTTGIISNQWIFSVVASAGISLALFESSLSLREIGNRTGYTFSQI